MNFLQLLSAVGFGALLIKLLDILWLSRLNYEQQKRNWLRDHRLSAYTNLTNELISFGTHLRDKKGPFESFAIASEAMLLVEDSTLIEVIDNFIVKIDRMNGLIDGGDDDEIVLEANVLYGELGREAKEIVRSLRKELVREEYPEIELITKIKAKFGI